MKNRNIHPLQSAGADVPEKFFEKFFASACIKRKSDIYLLRH